MNLDNELEAIRWALDADCTELIYVTQSQVFGLVSLMRQVLKKREERIAVLRLLIGDFMEAHFGVTVESTKNVTLPVASYLINQLLEPDSDPWVLSKYGQELLEKAHERVQEVAVHGA